MRTLQNDRFEPRYISAFLLASLVLEMTMMNRLFLCLLLAALSSGRLTETHRREEYYKRGYTWPPNR
jgi:hypothetical protein